MTESGIRWGGREDNTRDAALADDPRTYVVLTQYPLQPDRRYYWRVRGVVGG